VLKFYPLYFIVYDSLVRAIKGAQYVVIHFFFVFQNPSRRLDMEIPLRLFLHLMLFTKESLMLSSTYILSLIYISVYFISFSFCNANVCVCLFFIIYTHDKHARNEKVRNKTKRKRFLT